ncbi:MAG: glycosyltransferase [Candidatus Pelagibacter sp.]
MKISFLSYSDFKGGASLAAYSIFKSIKKKALKINFLCINKKYKNSKVIYGNYFKIYLNIVRTLEKILIFFFLKKKFHQSLNLFKTNSDVFIREFNPDIINIHWINRSMISLREILNLNSKLVISLHDMWFLNSTQHYFEYIDKKKDFLSNHCWELKKKILYNNKTFFIAHNLWMFKKFKKLFPKIKNKIFLCNYYPINTTLFKPRNKLILRKKHGVPLNKRVVFFSAQDFSDQRKGFLYFKEIINTLGNDKSLFFVSLGKKNFYFKNINNFKHFDFMPNQNTSEIYSLSDIYICTSLIDNLPLTILEALSSGNVVFSFDNGGSKEVLKNIGYTFKFSEIKKMTEMIKNIKKEVLIKKGRSSRKFATKYLNKNKIGTTYSEIFNKVNKINVSNYNNPN